MWPDDLARQKDEPGNEQVCFVKGAIDPRSQNGKPLLLLTRFLSIDQAQRELTRVMLVTVRMSEHGPEHIDAIARALKRTPGSCPVLLDVRDPGGRWARLKLADEFSINPLNVAAAELEEVLGAGTVKFSGPTNGRDTLTTAGASGAGPCRSILSESPGRTSHSRRR